MIRTGRFNEFITEFVRMHNQETEEKTMWEFYLHRYSRPMFLPDGSVFDMSFKDFMDTISKGTEQQFTESDLEETIAHSFDMLMGFNPCQSLS